jgi:hypothetical protein
MSSTPQQHSDEDIAPDDEDSDTSAAEGDDDSTIETGGLNGDGKDSSSNAGESKVSSLADLDPDLQKIKGLPIETQSHSIHPLIF